MKVRRRDDSKNGRGNRNARLHTSDKRKETRVTVGQRDHSPVPADERPRGHPEQPGLREHGDHDEQAEAVQLGDVHRHARSRRRRHEVSVRRELGHSLVRRHCRPRLCLLRSDRTGVMQAHAQHCREAQCGARQQDSVLLVQGGRGRWRCRSTESAHAGRAGVVQTTWS